MDRESNSNKQSGNMQIHLKIIDNVNNTTKTSLTFERKGERKKKKKKKKKSKYNYVWHL
jgi:hypothetical protein